MAATSVRILAALALLCGAAACDNSTKTPSASAPHADGGDSAAVAKADKPDDKGESAAKGGGGGKVKVVEGAPPSEDERYKLEFDTPDAKAGEEGKVTVRVVPKEPWHMNLDYPTSLELTAPESVALAKGKLKKGDAKKLDESSCEFDVAFTPKETGEATLAGQFKFAVCQDEACSPVTESVELKVAVK